jgi:hypothetical protein
MEKKKTEKVNQFLSIEQSFEKFRRALKPGICDGYDGKAKSAELLFQKFTNREQ